MADINIDNLTVLLLGSNIIVATADKTKILYSLKPTAMHALHRLITDTIQELRTGQVGPLTTIKEQEQFLKWFHPNINNIKEIYESL